MIYNLLETTMRLMSRQVFEASRNSRAQWLRDLLDLADRWKPQGYDDACRQLRDYYQGDQNQYLLSQMKRQFPTTWQYLPLITMPVTARWVDQQATVYLKPAGRMLKQPDGSDVADPEVQNVWGKLQDRAAYAEEWQALDRAVHLYRAALMQWRWNSWRQQVELDIIPPDLVSIIPDTDDPGDISRAWAVMIELASDKGLQRHDLRKGQRRFLVWWRAMEDNGRGPWQAAVIHEDGSVELEPTEDAQDFTSPIRDGDGSTVLPFALVRKDALPGELWPRPPLDMVDAQDNLNLTWVDLTMRARTSGYGVFVATALDAEQAEGALNLAPGGVSILNEGESLSTITADSRLSDHLSMLEDFILQQSQRMGLSPTAWSPKNRQALSGVALKVENLEAELHREQQIRRYQRLEEGDAFDIARAVHNTYSEAAPLPFDLEMVWMPGPSTLPVDEEANRRVLDHDVSKNWLSSSQAMAKALGVTEQQAAQQIQDNILANRQEIRPAGMGLAEAAFGIPQQPAQLAVTALQEEAAAAVAEDETLG